MIRSKCNNGKKKTHHTKHGSFVSGRLKRERYGDRNEEADVMCTRNSHQSLNSFGEIKALLNMNEIRIYRSASVRLASQAPHIESFNYVHSVNCQITRVQSIEHNSTIKAF